MKISRWVEGEDNDYEKKYICPICGRITYVEGFKFSDALYDLYCDRCKVRMIRMEGADDEQVYKEKLPDGGSIG